MRTTLPAVWRPKKQRTIEKLKDTKTKKKYIVSCNLALVVLRINRKRLRNYTYCFHAVYSRREKKTFKNFNFFIF